MSADDWRIYIAGFFSPILLLIVWLVAMSLWDWVRDKALRWKASRYNTIYARGYDAGKRDCEEKR